MTMYVVQIVEYVIDLKGIEKLGPLGLELYYSYFILHIRFWVTPLQYEKQKKNNTIHLVLLL